MADSFPVIDPGSFRDPAGQVVHHEDRIFRIVAANYRETFAKVLQTGALERLATRGSILRATVLSDSSCPPAIAALASARSSGRQRALVLEHPRLHTITYPFEWPFEALRDAAIVHLDLHLELLTSDLTLSDATAFNMQLIDGRPVHIDTLSIIPYVEGEPWTGNDQFLREFFNPLLLEAATGVTAANHYRGGLSGLATTELNAILPLRWKLRPSVAMHVTLPAHAAQRATKQTTQSTARAPAHLSKRNLVHLLQHLKRTINAVPSPPRRAAIWSNYAQDNSYLEEEASVKAGIVGNWVRNAGIRSLVDIGCNTGAMTDVALAHGVQRAVAVDSDRASLDIFWRRIAKGSRACIPLDIDFANPTPASGWAGRERAGLIDRIRADGVIALAVVHHLAIGRNIPLQACVDALIDIAGKGLIEFVPKADPMVGLLLRNRRDIFPDYTVDAFRQSLNGRVDIVAEHRVTSTGRTIFAFERRA